MYGCIDDFRGKFGIVRRCTEKATKKKLAAKFITVNRLEDRREVEREIDIMRSLQHPRLLQLFDAFDDGKTQMCLIMEWSVTLSFIQISIIKVFCYVWAQYRRGRAI